MPAPTSIGSNEFVITIITGTLLFLMLIGFSIAFLLVFQKRRKSYQEEKRFMEVSFKRELLQTQLETQEHTLNEMGRELHDNIGQLLSTIKLLLGIALRESGTIPDTLRTAEQTLGKAITDLRLLSKSLSNEWLNQFNLVENLESEKQRINAARHVEVVLSSEFDKMPMEPEPQVMLFRIVQEALQNAIKYAEAKRIYIEIKSNIDHFELSIQDNGKGFNVQTAKQQSLGLRNMEYRTHLLGGVIEWHSELNSGTNITILIPKT